jgi:tetratricopeptide (TPR) repeat protein
MDVPADVRSLLESLIDLQVPRGTVDVARRALGDAPDDIGSWVELAVHLRENGANDAALLTYDTAIRRFPNDALLWNNRGFVLLAMGQATGALTHFERAIELRPGYTSALEHRANALEQLHRFDEAADAYREALRVRPDSPTSWNSLGVCLLQLGDQEEAKACFEKAAALDPAFGDPLYNLMMSARDEGHLADAASFARRLLAINPGDSDAQRVVAESGALVHRVGEHGSDDAGNRPNEYDILAEAGHVALRKARLEEAMKRYADVRPVCYPPRIFLSYKWESTEHRAYVASLADALIDAGWEVVIDRDFKPERYASVEEFVAQLTTCGIFLAVATPAYVMNAIYPPGDNPSWVFDECQSAMLGELRIHRIALTPDGQLHVPQAKDEIFRLSRPQGETEIQLPFKIPAIYIEKASDPTFDEIYKMPAQKVLPEWVAEHMSFAGEPLPPDAAAEVSSELYRLTDVDQDALLNGLSRLVEAHPRVSAIRSRHVQALREAGRLQEALHACEDALQKVDPRDGSHGLQRVRLELLEEAGDRRGCAYAALDLVDRYPSDWMAHLVIGNQLDDLDYLWAARNHLLLATANANAPAGAHNFLGVIYQRLGLLLCAQRSFNRALELDPSNELALRNLDLNQKLEPRHGLADRLSADLDGLGCSHCRSIYDVGDDRPVLCARCGVARTVTGRCPACDADDIIFFIPDVPGEFCCPTCRHGSLERKAHFQL